METIAINTPRRVPWNKSQVHRTEAAVETEGDLGHPDSPATSGFACNFRIRLQLSARTGDLAIFNLAIDSKLRACDLIKLRVRDICHVQHVCITGNAHAAENAASGPVRAYRAHPG
jgi:hypothetical protein